MNLSHGEKRKLFEREFSAPFLKSVVSALEKLYPETFEETGDLPKSFQRYLQPHLLRAKAEVALMKAAGQHQLVSTVAYNRSGDGHTLIVADPFVVTLSRADGPRVPPRRANFRRDYSSYASLGQFPLPFVEADGESEPIPVRDQTHPIYVVVAHGPLEGTSQQVGFIVANFLALDGEHYIGLGWNLLSMYGTMRETTEEVVAEPSVKMRTDSDEHQALG